MSVVLKEYGVQVSASGNVYSLKSQKFLKHQMCRAGYHSVGVTHKGKRKKASVHRLVAMAFLGEAPNGKNEVNHKDGNKSNNHYENLEWVSRQENMHHAWTSGKTKHCGRPVVKTTRNKAVAALKNLGWKHSEIAECFGIAPEFICEILHKVNGK